MSPTHTTGRLRVGWLVRVISESFSGLVSKTCGPINTIWDTGICSPNRRIRATHDHSSPISVLSLPDLPIQWFFLVFRTCYHHRGSFHSVFWGSAPRPMTRSATLGRAFSLMKPFLARLICHTSFPCCCYILACSVLPLFCAWLLPCPFPSDVPGQHRRAFITNVQVPVLIVSINAFFWCLHQDSMTDFYVLPRFSAADRHHSSTAIIMVHHFAVWFPDPAAFCLPIHFFHHLCIESLLYFMNIFCLLAFSWRPRNSDSNTMVVAGPFLRGKSTSSKPSFPRFRSRIDVQATTVDETLNWPSPEGLFSLYSGSLFTMVS